MGARAAGGWSWETGGTAHDGAEIHGPEGVPVPSRYAHLDPSSGGCLMEIVSVLAGERFSDAPRCTHPALGGLVARLVNDVIRRSGDVAAAGSVPGGGVPDRSSGHRGGGGPGAPPPRAPSPPVVGGYARTCGARSAATTGWPPPRGPPVPRPRPAVPARPGHPRDRPRRPRPAPTTPRTRPPRCVSSWRPACATRARRPQGRGSSIRPQWTLR